MIAYIWQSLVQQPLLKHMPQAQNYLNQASHGFNHLNISHPSQTAQLLINLKLSSIFHALEALGKLHVTANFHKNFHGFSVWKFFFKAHRKFSRCEICWEASLNSLVTI